MTGSQYIAVTKPCLLAFETAHPRYASYIEEQHVSLVLTVNSGYE